MEERRIEGEEGTRGRKLGGGKISHVNTLNEVVMFRNCAISNLHNRL